MQIKSGFTRPLNLKYTLKAQTMRIEFKKAPILKYNQPTLSLMFSLAAKLSLGGFCVSFILTDTVLT